MSEKNKAKVCMGSTSIGECDPIKTGMDFIDNMFKGGLEKGKIAVFGTQHHPRSGKSMFLENIKTGFIFNSVVNNTMVIPCECNTGSMKIIIDAFDKAFGKYRCTGCDIVREKI